MSHLPYFELTKLIRYFILQSTTAAGSGHPTSSLSIADVMTVLFAGGYFKADLQNPKYPNNDRLIFSKGHASPLFYALYALVDQISYEELLTLRKFGSRLEGHPTVEFPYTEAATGSLGQGLGIGVGMAINAQKEALDYRTFVVLGDSELAEGSNWEAAQMAGFYKLNNLIAIADINRLGQRGQTMEGWDLENYKAKFEAFGWEVYVIDGHDLQQIDDTFKTLYLNPNPQPKIILAKTKKGAGISFLADQDGWHGKALNQGELAKALPELGEIDLDLRIDLPKPSFTEKSISQDQSVKTLKSVIPAPILEAKKQAKNISPRHAYGLSISNLGHIYPEIMVLDAETSNSTFADIFKKELPNRFIECFIAEQNMVSVALGLSKRGKIPFISTFAAFFSRAFDQIRMSQYSQPNIKFVGSHAGISIGVDGASQMALEDLAMFRAVHGMTIFYPCDGVSTSKLTEIAAQTFGNFYLRITRADLPLIYNENEQFEVGGSKTLKYSTDDIITIFAAGITLHESLKAYHELQEINVNIRIVDLYSIKPLDLEAIQTASSQTKAIIVVEDHYPQGGIFEAVYASGAVQVPIFSLAVNSIPHSGTPAELLHFEKIDAAAIVNKIKEVIEMVS